MTRRDFVTFSSRMTFGLASRPLVSAQPNKAITKASTGFLPSKNGFHFANNFTLKPQAFGFQVASWDMGLCGGMCFAALDRFFPNTTPPPDTTPPKDGTPLFEEIFDRMLDNLVTPTGEVIGPKVIYEKVSDWQLRPDEGDPLLSHSVGYFTKQ